jgi:hypothetical protein
MSRYSDGLRAWRQRSRSSIPGSGNRVLSFARLETGSGTRQASYTMGTGGFIPCGKEARVRFPALPGKKKVVGLERGPLSLVSTTEELLVRKVAAPF